MKILVAIDHSSISESVVQRSLSLAQPIQAEVILLTVVETPPAYFSSIALPTGDLVGIQNFPDLELEAKLRAIAENLLNHYQSVFTAAKVQCQTRLEQGNARETICQVAKAENVDFLAIGSRGLGNLERLMLGSVSDYVVHHAHCAVIVVR
jgi:nucleotide-binding universal stress UspA family protein